MSARNPATAPTRGRASEALLISFSAIGLLCCIGGLIALLHLMPDPGAGTAARDAGAGASTHTHTHLRTEPLAC